MDSTGAKLLKLAAVCALCIGIVAVIVLLAQSIVG